MSMVTFVAFLGGQTNICFALFHNVDTIAKMGTVRVRTLVPAMLDGPVLTVRSVYVYLDATKVTANSHLNVNVKLAGQECFATSVS